jgi:hypothetical protein
MTTSEIIGLICAIIGGVSGVISLIRIFLGYRDWE